MHKPEPSGRSLAVGLAVIVVAVAVAVLSSPLVGDLWPAGSATDTGSTGASGAPTTVVSQTPAAGSGLLVVTQEGKVALVALLYAGPKGGAILGMPGVTLLRSGDRFVRLADVYSPDAFRAVAGPIASMLGVPEGAVAAVEWRGLRVKVAGAVAGGELPEVLDPQGADAGAVAAVLAITLTAGGAVGSGWWQSEEMTGDADGFRAALEAAAASADGHGWTGRVLTGGLVEYAAGSAYLEPDVGAAKASLAGAGG
jgi:hypothetical protein